jgi:hypothetical protein
MDSQGPVPTIKLQPRGREAIKPAELIQITGHQPLSLYARRAITILWHNAHLQEVEAGKDYTIEIDNLKTDGHKGYDAVEDAIVSLTSSPSNSRMARHGACGFLAATISTLTIGPRAFSPTASTNG